MADRDQLRRVPLFARLPPMEVDVLAATLPSAAYPSGALLFREGEPGDRLYLVLEGEVEIVKALGSAEERVLNVFGPGAMLGEMSLLTPGETRSAGARARGGAEVATMTREDFETLLRRYPALCFDVLRVLADRLREADNALIRELRAKNEELTRAYAELQARHDQMLRENNARP
jgi:CRP-like cAMP-binding protein